MDNRRTARLAGILYLVTHVTSIAAVALYGSLRTDPAWLEGPSSALAPTVGALTDVFLALAVLGTGVLIHTLLRTVDATSGFAYAALRTLEGGAIIIGAAMMATAANMSVSGPGGVAASNLLVDAYHWVFLMGMGLVVTVHTVILALALRRHRLVPTWITTVGLLGAAVVGASNLAIAFDLHAQSSATAALAALPIFVWEISLAVHLIWKGLLAPSPK